MNVFVGHSSRSNNGLPVLLYSCHGNEISKIIAIVHVIQ